MTPEQKRIQEMARAAGAYAAFIRDNNTCMTAGCEGPVELLILTLNPAGADRPFSTSGVCRAHAVDSVATDVFLLEKGI